MPQPMPDLFGHMPSQGDLFAGEAVQARAVPQVDPEAVRLKLQAMLADMRAAEGRSPWSREKTRLNQLLFPQMSNWLPEAERNQLRFEFDTELKRLNVAVG